jgi:hypothetical protein
MKTQLASNETHLGDAAVDGLLAARSSAWPWRATPVVGLLAGRTWQAIRRTRPA